MKLVLKFLLLMIIACGTMLPVFAVTLQMGTYNLEWETSKSGQYELSQWPVFAQIMDIGSPPDVEGLKLTSAATCAYTESDRFAIIVDESSGAGQGYDTAYLFAKSSADEKLDVNKSTKLTLVKDEEIGYLHSEGDCEIDLPIGGSDSKVIKKAPIELTVFIEEIENEDGNDAEPQKMMFAQIVGYGGWFGKIKTDKDDLSVQLVDSSSNGLFNDKGSNFAQGDMVLLGDFSPETEEVYTTQILGDAVFYDGNLYSLNVSKLGDTIEVKPYDGPSGKLKVEAKDGYNKLVTSPVISLFGDTGRFNVNMGQVSLLPVSEYGCTIVITPDENDTDFYLIVRKFQAVSVTENETATLKLGGPITMKIDSPSDTITVKRGEELNVSLLFAVGGGSLAGVGGGREAAVNIRDAKGKLLISGKAGFG